MKPLVVILLLAITVQAQSVADAARKERERQAQLRSTRVIVSTQNPSKPAEPATPDAAKPAAAEAAKAPAADAAGKSATDKSAPPAPSKDLPKPQPAPPPDPLQIWTARMDELRMKIRTLEDQETTLRLQVGQLSNQIYAPVTDPDTQARVQTQLGQTQQQLITVRADLEQTKKMLDALQLEGPPAKK